MQADFANLDLFIGLGWYGNFETNQGSFMIIVIENFNWDKPIFTTKSVSQALITEKLQYLLKVYGSK